MPRPPGLSSREDLLRAPRSLQTARLLLQVPDASHAPAFLDSVLASRHTFEYIAWGHGDVDLAWAERFCTRGAALVDDGECLIFNAFERDGGRYVARIDLHSFDFDAPRAEIGYVGDARVAGRGLVREAALAVVALAFELGFARVHAISETGNAAALRFAEALGFVREGQLRAWERDRHGRLCDQVMFAAYNPAPCQ